MKIISILQERKKDVVIIIIFALSHTLMFFGGYIYAKMSNYQPLIIEKTDTTTNN